MRSLHYQCKIKFANPRYIVDAAVDNDKPLSQYSCFVIHRSLNLIGKEIISISQLRDGKLLSLMKDNLTANQFLESKELLAICKITCKLYEHLNFIKGTLLPYASLLITLKKKL